MIPHAKQIIKFCLGLIALSMTTGCIHNNVHYEPTREHIYSPTPFVSAKMDSGSAGSAESDVFQPVNHALAVSEPAPQTNVLGNVHIKNPLSLAETKESMIFSVRKENRAYMAETPIGSAFQVGKRTVTPHFALGLHKDHDALAGFVFRMNF